MKKRILLILSLILITSGFAQAQTARRTVTNADLEKYRQKRVRAEADYRANYEKLGMPSPEELEKQEAERQAWLAEYAQQAEAENQQTEGYFLARANQLKSQIIGVQAQINYLRGQIGNLPSPQNSPFISIDQLSTIGVVGVGVLSGGGRGNYNLPRGGVVTNAPNVQTAINSAASAPNPYVGTPLERTGVKVVIGQPNVIRRGGYRRPYFYGGYGVPYVVNNSYSSREEMISDLRSLEQTKAGLLAQLEYLRDEARRAGVKID